jgi:hypothetical protein
MELKPILLGKDILLFKNVLSDKKFVTQFIKDSKKEPDKYFGEWYDWKPFGSYVKAYPNNTNEWETDDTPSAKIIRESIDIFFSALKIYKENYFNDEYFEQENFKKDIPVSYEELKKDNSYKIADIPIFETQTTDLEIRNLCMDYHQDRKFWFAEPRHVFNFNIYVNDDYLGGEILFIDLETAIKSTFTNSEGNEIEYLLIEQPIKYKMEAGDAMLFRTDVYHAVLPIVGKKHYIRHFLTAPAEEWVAEEKLKHTDEEWEALKIEKHKEDNTRLRTPLVFDSVEDIDINSQKYTGWVGTQIPCVINKKIVTGDPTCLVSY